MSAYAFVRTIYRFGDRVLLRWLPASARSRVQGVLFRLARGTYPERIEARSVAEFAGNAPSNKLAASRRLPPWAEAEVAALVDLEPELAALIGEQASLEPYFIPWDMTYVGVRYANARRQLAGDYASFVLAGSGRIDAAVLADVPRPLAVIDIDADGTVAAMARTAGADYVALPAENLDQNDHCAVLARLVLQLAPRQLRHARHPLLDRCIERHGLALASVTELRPLQTPAPGNGMAERLPGL